MQVLFFICKSNICLGAYGPNKKISHFSQSLVGLVSLVFFDGVSYGSAA